VRRRMDEGQGAHGQEARRGEGEKRDGRVALVGAEEPGAPGTVKPHRNLDEAAPEAPVRVGLAAPVPPFRADAELRGARELEVLPPQCVEIGRASCRERVEISVVGGSVKKKIRREVLSESELVVYMLR